MTYHFCSILCQLHCFEQICLIGLWIKLQNWSKWPWSVNRNLTKNTSHALQFQNIYNVKWLHAYYWSVSDFRNQKLFAQHSLFLPPIEKMQNYFQNPYLLIKSIHLHNLTGKKRLSAHAKAIIANNLKLFFQWVLLFQSIYRHSTGPHCVSKEMYSPSNLLIPSLIDGAECSHHHNLHKSGNACRFLGRALHEFNWILCTRRAHLYTNQPGQGSHNLSACSSQRNQCCLVIFLSHFSCLPLQ